VPSRTVNWRHSNTGASVKALRAMGSYGSATSLHGKYHQAHRDNTVDEHGGVSGQINIIITGQEALRCGSGLRNDADEVKSNLITSWSRLRRMAVETHVDHFLGRDTPDSNLMVFQREGTLARNRSDFCCGIFLRDARASAVCERGEAADPVDMDTAAAKRTR